MEGSLGGCMMHWRFTRMSNSDFFPNYLRKVAMRSENHGIVNDSIGRRKGKKKKSFVLHFTRCHFPMSYY